MLLTPEELVVLRLRMTVKSPSLLGDCSLILIKCKGWFTRAMQTQIQMQAQTQANTRVNYHNSKMQTQAQLEQSRAEQSRAELAPTPACVCIPHV